MILGIKKIFKPLLVCFALGGILAYPPPVSAHRSACHQWHSCPSDSGSYICGNKGYCSYCPDNQFCVEKERREVSSQPSEGIPHPNASVMEFSGKVVGVSDGDTIKVMRGGVPVKVRLAEIDCPEKDQPFGTKAKRFTSELVFGKKVKVISKGNDVFGRVLGEVFLPDGRSLNQELLLAGLAWHYKRFSKDEKLAELEGVARVGKLGLWRDKDPVPPWVFRKRDK